MQEVPLDNAASGVAERARSCRVVEQLGDRVAEAKPGESPGVTGRLRFRAAVESLIPRRSAPTKSRDRWRVIGCRDGSE